MDDSLWNIARILYYLVFVAALFFYTKYKYKNKEISKISWIAIIIFAIIFGIYAVICGPPNEDVGDRYQYAVKFEEYGYSSSVRNSSLGLYLLEEFLHLFTRNSSVLFFVVGFIFCFINLYCYRKTKEETPLFLLFLFLTKYGLFGLFALKQALALAFVNLAFTLYWRDKKWLALFMVVIAVLFHESALIVIPCFVLGVFFAKNNKRLKVFYAISGMLLLLFPLVCNLAINLVTNFVPVLASQLTQYVDGDGLFKIDFNFFTIFNYLVYYVITVIAIVMRGRLKNEIKKYDLLLIFAVFASVFSMLSMYMYWMFRFGMFFYVPVFLLAIQICEKIQRDKRKVFVFFIISLLLVFMLKLLIQYYFIYGGII